MNRETKELLWEAFKEGARVDNCNKVDSQYYRDKFERWFDEKFLNLNPLD